MAFIVFDCETTGLTLHPNADLDRQPRMIEFGAAVIDARGKVIDQEDFLINPGISLPAEITKITGITDADLEGRPDFDWCMPRIRALFAKADTMIAHNLPFDRAVLRGELHRLNVINFPWPKHALCTIDIYRELWGRQMKLSELYSAVIGAPLNQSHRALDDVFALVEILNADDFWTKI